MRLISGRHGTRTILGAVLLLSCVLVSPAPADAAGYSRRMAIAPFASLAKEDIGATVSVLPRLLASRLMALAGADVVLLPADGKAPEAAAKEAKVPLLLQGTVSKLGKGYSVDTTATDLETGKTAGAFFAVAATEDDIIAQLGVLSGEIAEKLFGVQGAIRATTPPAPVATSPAPAAAPAPSGIPSIGGGPGVSAASPATVAPPPAPVAASPAEGWVPSSLKKVGQSDKIADEIYGVAAGDMDEEGNGEVVTFGRNVIYIYRVKGNECVPYTRISRGISRHFLNVEAVDIDGDGKKDLVVTDRDVEILSSFVMFRRGDGFVEGPTGIHYHLVTLRDWNGRTVVAGQRRGVGTPFQGKFYLMKWDGKTLVEGETLPLDVSVSPLSDGGIYSLSSARFGEDQRWLYVDMDERLRVLESGGKSIFRSKVRYGASGDGFEHGELNARTGLRTTYLLRRAPRVVPGTKGAPFVVVTEITRGILQNVVGSHESSRAVVLRWEGGGFSEQAGSQKSDFFYSGVDVLLPGGFRGGGRVIASVIEQPGSLLHERVSRLVLLRVE